MKIKKDIVKSVKYAQRNEHKNGCEQQDGLERIVKKSASVAATNASHAMLYPSEVSFDDVCKNNAKLGDGAATTTTTTTRIKVTTTIGQGPRDGEEERSHQKVQARLAGFHQYVMENFFKDRKMDGEKWRRKSSRVSLLAGVFRWLFWRFGVSGVGVCEFGSSSGNLEHFLCFLLWGDNAVSFGCWRNIFPVR